MASNAKIAKESGPIQQGLLHPPSRVVLVCGPRESTDPRVLDLADKGFLRVVHNPKHFAFDERAGTVIPTDAYLAGIKAVGQLEAGAVQRDGDDYFVQYGRNRLKALAMLNAEESEKQGKFVEPYQYRFVIVTGTEELAFLRSVVENEHRVQDTATVRAAKMLRGKTVFGWSDEYIGTMFGGISASQVKVDLGLNELSTVARKAVDAGFPAAVASRKLTRFPRDKQADVIAQCEAAGIRRGKMLEDALDRLRDGKPLVDPDAEVSPESSDTNETPETNPANDSKPRKPHTEKPTGFVRNPTSKQLDKWVAKLRAAAKDPPKVPEKYQEAVDKAFAAGAAMMAARFTNKEPKGFGAIKKIVEAEDEN